MSFLLAMLRSKGEIRVNKSSYHVATKDRSSLIQKCKPLKEIFWRSENKINEESEDVITSGKPNEATSISLNDISFLNATNQSKRNETLRHAYQKMIVNDENLTALLASGFLSQLCRLLQDVYLQIYISFCHKTKFIYIQDSHEFETFVLKLRNMFFKARTFPQFNRQMILRGFREKEVGNEKHPYAIAYEHDDDVILEIFSKYIGNQEKCCKRKHI